jgi:hypothetical protein
VRVNSVVIDMGDLEKAAIKNLEDVLRQSAWTSWLTATKGVGAKQLGRFLSATGDPYWHIVEDRPRTVGELWAYCGYHAVPVDRDGRRIMLDDDAEEFHQIAPRRQKGVQGNWSDDARKRAWLIANSCVKQAPDAPLRMVYDAARAKYAEATHIVPCIRCGPSGKPAAPGTDLNDGHKHGRALRAVSKEVLKRLWVESRRQHGDEDPDGPDARARAEGTVYSGSMRELEPAPELISA